MSHYESMMMYAYRNESMMMITMMYDYVVDTIHVGLDVRALSFDGVDRYIGNHPYCTHYHTRHPVVLLVDLDAALQAAIDCLLNQLISVKIDRTKQVFLQHAAASNGGVFSFSGFKKMMLQVAPRCSDGLLLTMFREALIRGRYVLDKPQYDDLG